MKIKARSVFLWFGLVFASSAGGQDLPPQTALQDIPLAEILAKSAAYCEKIKDIALYYICRQKIEDVNFSYREREANVVESPFLSRKRIKFDLRGSESNHYLYDYQLVNKNGSLAERWKLLEENGRRRNQEIPAPKNIRFNASHVVYGPVGFLSKSWQDHFRYEITGREDLDGKAAVVIRCEPIIRGGENDNTARIWVDVRNWEILRIEWEPSSIKGYDDKAPEGYRKSVVWMVVYDIEKNGVRFPSRQVVREYLLDDKDLKIPLEEITFLYEDYKFFTVGVDVVYRP